MGKFKASELIVWKEGECPDCELRNCCTQSRGNLETCTLEEHMLYKDNPFDYLIRRVIRCVCAEDRKERRKLQKLSEEAAARREKQKFRAALFCADHNEFTSCRS